LTLNYGRGTGRNLFTLIQVIVSTEITTNAGKVRFIGIDPIAVNGEKVKKSYTLN
jgi:hypothetical protein